MGNTVRMEIPQYFRKRFNIAKIKITSKKKDGYMYSFFLKNLIYMWLLNYISGKKTNRGPVAKCP